MRYFVTFPSGDEIPVEVEHLPSGEISVAVHGRQLSADAVALGGCTSMCIDHRMVDLWIDGAPPRMGFVARGHRLDVAVESDQMRALASTLGPRSGAGEGTVVSPMPGRVLKVLVAEGERVALGAALVVVEAMKMENELSAARAGTVRKIHVAPGQTVESGALLVEIE
jgi:biotin carboxyl carrier protein